MEADDILYTLQNNQSILEIKPLLVLQGSCLGQKA